MNGVSPITKSITQQTSPWRWKMNCCIMSFFMSCLLKFMAAFPGWVVVTGNVQGVWEWAACQLTWIRIWFDLVMRDMEIRCEGNWYRRAASGISEHLGEASPSSAALKSINSTGSSSSPVCVPAAVPLAGLLPFQIYLRRERFLQPPPTHNPHHPLILLWHRSEIHRLCVWLCGLVYENKHAPFWFGAYYLSMCFSLGKLRPGLICLKTNHDSLWTLRRILLL